MQNSLRKIRTNKKLNLQAVAKEVDCDPSNLSRIERGIQQPTVELAERISNFYDGEISVLEIIYLKRNSQFSN